MKKLIVIPTHNGILDPHFGHARVFTFVEILDNNIIKTYERTPPPHETGVLPRWAASEGATDIIAGGMGQKAIQIFNQNNINVFVGAPQLGPEELAKGLAENTIAFNANYCDH